MQNEKWALFDFCETLVNFQTADAFVYYVCEHSPNKHVRRWRKIYNMLRKIKLVAILERITRHKLSINKQLVLYSIKGQSETTIKRLAKDYYNECIVPNIIKDIFHRMKQCQHDGYKVMIVSGGYDVYIQHFVAENHLDGLLATQIAFKKGFCTGRFKSEDCLRQGKIRYLNSSFQQKPDFSVAYSDSRSDLPFLKWADESYVVSKNTSQFWTKENNLKEIIWEE